MVDIRSRSPPREGVRGGLETFNWETIRVGDSKDRDCYLGHSVKLGLAQRGRFYKHDWWSKKREEEAGEGKEGTDTKARADVRVVQKYEQALMQEALGVKPKAFLNYKKGGAEEGEARKKLFEELEKEKAIQDAKSSGVEGEEEKQSKPQAENKKHKKSKKTKLMKKLSKEIKRQEERLLKRRDLSSSSESSEEACGRAAKRHSGKRQKRPLSPESSDKHVPRGRDVNYESKGRRRSCSRSWSPMQQKDRRPNPSLSPPRRKRRKS